MSYGYSQRLVDANKEADDESWGVLLGRKCIELDIPVGIIASRFNVSRATIYNWFWGATTPSKSHAEQIERALPRLRKLK
jgi:hypothetical protein